jgi:hypothetical protein
MINRNKKNNRNLKKIGCLIKAKEIVLEIRVKLKMTKIWDQVIIHPIIFRVLNIRWDIKTMFLAWFS